MESQPEGPVKGEKKGARRGRDHGGGVWGFSVMKARNGECDVEEDVKGKKRKHCRKNVFGKGGNQGRMPCGETKGCIGGRVPSVYLGKSEGKGECCLLEEKGWWDFCSKPGESCSHRRRSKKGGVLFVSVRSRKGIGAVGEKVREQSAADRL